jgi:DNA-binding IclR family transcriptional regulator
MSTKRPTSARYADVGRTGARRSPGSQSLERGLDILEMIEGEGGSIGVRAIARKLELSPTIVQRLINSLAARGYIEKDRDSGHYRLGHRSLALGASGEHDFDYIVSARAELEKLAHEYHLNGFVSVLRDGRAIYLLAVQADGPIAIRVTPGSEMPLHSTAAGKILLAAMTDSEARKLIGPRRMAAITPHSITDPAALIAGLRKVRTQGYATVIEENIPGVLSVGAPIRDRMGGVVAALSVAFPKYLDSGLTLATVTPIVTSAAHRISRTLGGEATVKPAAAVRTRAAS